MYTFRLLASELVAAALKTWSFLCSKLVRMPFELDTTLLRHSASLRGAGRGEYKIMKFEALGSGLSS